MATFHVFGVPVTIGGVVPDPDELAEEYKQIYDNNDDASIDRVLDIEATMHKEYNLVQSHREWVEFDEGGNDEEQSSGGNWFTRMFS